MFIITQDKITLEQLINNYNNLNKHLLLVYTLGLNIYIYILSNY